MSGAFAAGGRFITFEGIDGAGKSTHLAEVAARLRTQAAAPAAKWSAPASLAAARWPKGCAG